LTTPFGLRTLGAPLADVHVQAAPDRPNLDSVLPYGLFSFNVVNVEPGGTATVQFTVPPGARPNAYLKSHPQTGQYYDFFYNGETGAVFDGDTITLHLIDGGRGDADGLVNGVIMDPGGPGATGVLDVCGLGATGWTVTQSGGSAGGSGPGTVALEGQ